MKARVQQNRWDEWEERWERRRSLLAWIPMAVWCMYVAALVIALR